MNSVHLLIPDLFLPKDIAAEACRDLRLPALEKMLGRGHDELLESASMEELLCNYFDITYQGDAPIASISAAFDGLAAGCWLRADPVNLSLQRDRLLLAGVQVGSEEAAALCASLNAHFAGQDIEFFAPHPQRWYMRLYSLPRITTTPLSEVIAGDVRKFLPTGEDAMRWHQLINETQMLLHAHPLNEVREARGKLMINSLWFWGGGCDTLLAKPADCGNSRQAAPPATEEDPVTNRGSGCDTLLMQPLAIRLGEHTTPAKSLVMAKPADCGNSRQAAVILSEEHYAASYSGGGQGTKLPHKYDCISSDDVLAEMFAAVAGIPFAAMPRKWNEDSAAGRQLLVWTGLRSALQRGDLSAWQSALRDFENGYARPLWAALRSGQIAHLQLDIPGTDSLRSVQLTRADAWAFWRRSRRLHEYSSK